MPWQSGFVRQNPGRAGALVRGGGRGRLGARAFRAALSGGPLGLAVAAAAGAAAFYDAVKTPQGDRIQQMYDLYGGTDYSTLGMDSAPNTPRGQRTIPDYFPPRGRFAGNDDPMNVDDRGYAYPSDAFRAKYIVDPTIRSVRFRRGRFSRYARNRRRNGYRRRLYRNRK